jgi:hypothetical protein
VRRRSGEHSEDVGHAFSLHAGEVEVGSVYLGNCLLHQGRPDLNAAVDLLAAEEEEVLAVEGGLDWDEVVDDDVPPHAVPAKADAVYSTLVCLLLPEELQHFRGLLSQDGQCAVDVGIAVFALAEKGGFAVTDDVDVVVVDAGKALEPQSLLLTQYLLVKDDGPFWREQHVDVAAATRLLLSDVGIGILEQALGRLEGRMVAPDLRRSHHQFKLVPVQPSDVLHLGRRLEVVGLLCELLAVQVAH